MGKIYQQGSLLHTPVHVAECTAAVVIPQAAAVKNILSAHFLLHSQRSQVEPAQHAGNLLSLQSKY